MNDFKGVLLVDSSYPINTRNYRIIDTLKAKIGENLIHFVTWNRENKEIKAGDNQNFILSLYSPLGDFKSKLKNLNKYRNYIKDINNRVRPKVLIASHWDNLILCALAKKKNQILVYENLDMPAGGKLVRRIINFFESLALKRTDCISYASRFFMPYYKNERIKHILLENKIPMKNALDLEISKVKNKTKESLNNKVVVTFNGALRFPEMFENLFKAAGDLENVEIHLYGYGTKSDYNKISAAAQPYSNIKFFGEYNYKDIPQIYSKSDFIWAVYPSRNNAVKYAISNKFYETIYYEVPGIFCDNTKLGDFVTSKNIGYKVDGYDVSQIRNLIINLRDNIIEEKKKILKGINIYKENESLMWEDECKELLDYITSL